MCWKSSKQDITTDSTTKVKYIAAAEVAKEGVWMKKFIINLRVVLGGEEQIPLYCDNNGAIAQVKELISHQKYSKEVPPNQKDCDLRRCTSGNSSIRR